MWSFEEKRELLFGEKTLPKSTVDVSRKVLEDFAEKNRAEYKTKTDFVWILLKWKRQKRGSFILVLFSKKILERKNKVVQFRRTLCFYS